jgi:hypothetical protein
MTTTTPKTKTCKACRGTGKKSTPVLHLGVPGLCYQCDGAGEQVRVSAEQVRLAYVQAAEAHMAELEGIAADLKAMVAADPSAAKFAERKLTQLRQTWKEASYKAKNPKPSRAKWVSPRDYKGYPKP